jgi:hypothetical protein
VYDCGCRSIEILQEKLQSAEARAARAEQGHSNELELQSRVSSLEIQLQAWETHANGVGVDGPQELADKLRELQTEYLAAGDRLSEREVELRKLTGSHSLLLSESLEFILNLILPLFTPHIQYSLTN